MPVPNCFDDYSFIALLEIKKCDTSCFALSRGFFGVHSAYSARCGMGPGKRSVPHGHKNVCPVGTGDVGHPLGQ